MGLEEAALYLHVPFCRAKCPYCDFYSLPQPPEEEILRKFLKALKKEVLLRRAELESYRFVTLYVGGGTPSLLPPWFYQNFYEFLEKELTFTPQEATLEANPEGLTLKYLRAVKSIFNRLSLGAQSLRAEGLRALGRRHSIDDIKKAFEAARNAEIKNISLDFIFGWPGQTLILLEQELKEIKLLAPEHISYYELTLEEGTAFYQKARKGKLSLPPEDEVIRMYEFVHSFLVEVGYEHYEISNFARFGFRCRHNLFYWEARPYLGLGPAAASYLHGRRTKTVEDLHLYLKSLEEGVLPPREVEKLTEEERFREAVILGLRLLGGIDLFLFRKRFQYDLRAYYGARLRRLFEMGLLEISDNHLRLTQKGRLLANAVFRELV